jgi:hypothetical protein
MLRPFPPHLLSDEKHTQWLGNKAYVATTVASGCFLGVEFSHTAATADLQTAYGVFAQEARDHHETYQPKTVNTDGWESTQIAWGRLFPGVTLILCFLHSILAIGQGCRSQRALWHTLMGLLWAVYHALNAPEFIARLRELQVWAIGQSLPDKTLTKILRLSLKASEFTIAYDFPDAHRTSNMLDRLMNYQDRILYSMQYFHGHRNSANLCLRAMAMLWNFHPYTRRSQPTAQAALSPFAELNGFCYHTLWLRNFLIASSMNGKGGGAFNKHTIHQN